MARLAGLSRLLLRAGRGFPHDSGADVFAKIHVLKLDDPDSFVSPSNRVFQLGCPRGDAQHAASVGVKLAITLGGSRMKDLYIWKLGHAIEPGDQFTGKEASGISAGGDDHAAGCVRRPMKHSFAHASFD